MRSPTRSWLKLTQFLLLAGCSSTHLPLDVEGGARERDKLPVEFAGNGSVVGSAARGGGAGAWAGDVMPQPRPPRSSCGDGRIQPPEACDRTDLNGATCASLGYAGGGTLLCNPTTCTYDTIMCRMSRPPTKTTPPPPDWGVDAGTDDAGS